MKKLAILYCSMPWLFLAASIVIKDALHAPPVEMLALTGLIWLGASSGVMLLVMLFAYEEGKAAQRNEEDEEDA